MRILYTCLLLTFNMTTGNIDWETVGGNSMRNGLNGMFAYPTNPQMITSVNALFGSQIYTSGNKFVLMRFQTIDYSPIVCHTGGTQLWVVDFPGSGSRSLPIGFRDNQVYAINFRESGNDTIYALNPDNGSVIWRSNGTYPIAGINMSAAFTSNGDLVLPETGGRVMRIDHTNGQKMWSTAVLTPNTGSQVLCIRDTIIYGWTGSITTPKMVYAMSAATGQIKYMSPALPGDGDQESSIMIGPTGILYVIRDGGNLIALIDNGTSITQKWSVPLTGTNTSILAGTLQMGAGWDNHIYVPYKNMLAKVDTTDGSIVDSSIALSSTSTFVPRVTITQNNMLFVSNGGFSDGAVYILDTDMNVLTTVPVTSINNSGPATLFPYSIVVAGNGTNIRIFDFPTGITGNGSELPEYTLNQNYPNPFNPETIINYELRTNGVVELSVFDVSGRLIRTLLKQGQVPGAYQIKFDGSGLPSGVYYYTLRAGDFIDTKKMILLR